MLVWNLREKVKLGFSSKNMTSLLSSLSHSRKAIVSRPNTPLFLPLAGKFFLWLYPGLPDVLRTSALSFSAGSGFIICNVAIPSSSPQYTIILFRDPDFTI